MKNERTFAGIDEQYASLEVAQIVLQSIPYDGTSTWGKGADEGFEAFLEAAENMELFDIETSSEVYKKGIHILPAILEHETPESMYRAVLSSTRKVLEDGKFPTFFGGEHSISIGLIEAFKEKYDDLTVVQIDAHADLRKEYLGTPYNHACAVHWASQHTDLWQVGIRSMDSGEREFMNRDKCYFAEDIVGKTSWMAESIERMEHENVYLTIDLDAFDPSIMPATGTPEPGGLGWYETLTYLKMLFRSKNVVGFDIVELAPISGLKAPQFLVAKLYYKLLSYKFHG
jgi:agmatinase